MTKQKRVVGSLLKEGKETVFIMITKGFTSHGPF